jgi:putative transposase
MICSKFGIHPKSIYKDKAPRVFYKKSSDSQVLIQINAIISLRPTYGYKRVTAMVNKLRKSLGHNKVNKKRIYRIMKINGLLLPKSIVTRTHKPTGKVMTLHSNTRWCSDCFEIKCFNGEKVYVSFVIDSCDREVISFIAKKEPLLADDIERLMIKSVKARFRCFKAPRQIEFLSDRGSIYRAASVQAIARTLGLKSCYTAAYSPESNGMSEALVKTIKRDYVYNNDCYSADVVLKMLNGWFKDYNEEALHSALGMKSPKEYLLANQR